MNEWLTAVIAVVVVAVIVGGVWFLARELRRADYRKAKMLVAAAQQSVVEVAEPVVEQPVGWDGVVHQRVLVTLLSGTAIEGVLVETSGPLLHLRDCRVADVGSTADPVGADGVVIVDRARVDFVQVATWR